MFADWVGEKERRHNCLVGIKSQNLLLLPRFGVYGDGTLCAMVETAQVWKREYLVSVQSSHLTAGCPWLAHSVLQSLPKRVQQDTGWEVPTRCQAQGWSSAQSVPVPGCFPTEKLLLAWEVATWWRSPAVAGGHLDGGVHIASPLEKARERGKTSKAKGEYHQVVFKASHQKEIQSEVSRNSGDILFPPSSCCPSACHAL